MRNCSRCGLALGVGVCLCSLAAAETHEFRGPSGPACSAAPTFRDFGPPAGCDGETLPHNRTGWLTSVAGATGSSVTSNGALFISGPLVASTARDAEDAAEATSPEFEVTMLGPHPFD